MGLELDYNPAYLHSRVKGLKKKCFSRQDAKHAKRKSFAYLSELSFLCAFARAIFFEYVG
jgi:hypothetical protein